MNTHFRSLSSSFCFLICLGLVSAQPSNAQDNAQRLGSQFVPFDAIAAVLLSPSAVMSSPATELYPHEIVEAWCLDNIGISPRDCESIKFVTAMPGPAGPMAALIVKMKSDFSISELNPQLIGDGTMIDLDGLKCIPIPSGNGVVIHQHDSRTAVLATQDWLDNVLAVADGNENGVLANLADKAPHDGHLTALLAIEPVRPMVNGLLQSQIDNIPPPFVEFTKIPNLLDAILIRLDMEDQETGANLTLLAVDDESAEEMQKIVVDGLQIGRAIAMQQMLRNVQGDDPIQEATQAYGDRVAELLIEKLTPKRKGRRLTLTTTPGGGMASNGVLVALLLPAVQSARGAARRVSSMNQLKQMGLAMHNYHDAYRELPVNQHSRDAEGKPLLSWRVHILPFVEEQALYEQFHMDEPWDSDHNLKLLERMPKIYEHPNVRLAPGMTIYQAPIGEELIFKPTEATRFRDITDGMSNTIMVFESNAESAVEWTRPRDVEIDLDNPLDVMGDQGPAFNALLGDGSVRQIQTTIDVETLRALLTSAGGERVNDF